jgi:hypothetical protein
VLLSRFDVMLLAADFGQYDLERFADSITHADAVDWRAFTVALGERQNMFSKDGKQIPRLR